MKIKRHTSEPRQRPLRDRGSALLVSLMVLAGLSLLALAFVAVSETEGKISSSQRNALQTQAIAEAGARAVVEWFQNPAWAESIGIMPTNNNNNVYPVGLKRRRDGTAGFYKPTIGIDRLFDLPFRPAEGNRFFGDDATADVQIDYTNSAATMTALNTYLFGADSRTAGRIEEIKVFAPPIVGGTLSPTGFWGGGQRFGTATIKVTARMWNRAAGDGVCPPDCPLSTQAVRIVVGEFPLPIPAGPIQTASNAAFGGAFNVYWGDEVALGDLNPAVNSTRIPWQNAFNRPSFEYGYDNEVFNRDTDLPPDGTIDQPNFLWELAGKAFQDPWVGARARGTVSICGACAAYVSTANEGDRIHAAFQNQTVTNFPVSRAVTFPTIDYNVWKRIALQSRGTKGVFYFTYDSGSGNYRRNGQGPAQPISFWVNVRAGANLGAGFYFFDTMTGANPQLTGGATNNAILGPAVDWQAAAFNGDFLMAGFIYMNVQQYRSTGAGNSATPLPYNMPGEIYRDIGYPQWDAAAGTWVRDAAGAVIRVGAGNGQWDCDDWDGDGCDIVVAGPQTVTSSDNGVTNTRNNVYLPVPWAQGPPACTPTTCSEPHEPYLNFIYPTTNTGVVTVNWEPAGAQTRRPRDLLGDNTLPNCGATPNLCTSNKYDRDGALVNIPATLAGVLYNEGSYNSTGNVDYFGSVLMRGPATATGNANVWFDEKLIKGNWAPPGMPRVIVYSSQTDELEEQ
jgi:hypothetical protein